ncbi:MAG: metalloregulator ArsR/SmtB family transcription factor [Phycisphaerae bacterium]|nr:metalloregulator ArsR/SmtB family transcription factor [Phycisphaerae bacterium]
MQDILAITKALADENRLRALMMLREQELCACQVIEVLGLAPSTVSKHMTILRQAGLVQARKEGRWMYYRLPQRSAAKPVKEALSFVKANLAESVQAKQDDKKLQRVLSVDRELLCKNQIKK